MQNHLCGDQTDKRIGKGKNEKECGLKAQQNLTNLSQTIFQRTHIELTAP